MQSVLFLIFPRPERELFFSCFNLPALQGAAGHPGGEFHVQSMTTSQGYSSEQAKAVDRPESPQITYCTTCEKLSCLLDAAHHSASQSTLASSYKACASRQSSHAHLAQDEHVKATGVTVSCRAYEPCFFARRQPVNPVYTGKAHLQNRPMQRSVLHLAMQVDTDRGHLCCKMASGGVSCNDIEYKPVLVGTPSSTNQHADEDLVSAVGCFATQLQS